MIAYDDWNARLVDYFFSPDQGSRAVRLAVTDDLLAELGGSREDFIRACRRGSAAQPVAAVKYVAEYAVDLMHCWRFDQVRLPSNFRMDIPPYVGYLGLFVLVNTGGPGFHNRLNDLFPVPRWVGGIYPGFNRVRELWEDLARWSTEPWPRNAQRHAGVFRLVQLGQYAHLSFLRAQTILTGAECRRLPSLFTRAELEPDDDLSDRQLVDIVHTHGGGLLGNLTREAADDPELGEYLREEIRRELRAWDGTGPVATGGSSSAQQASAPVELRLYRSRGQWFARLCVTAPSRAGSDLVSASSLGVGPVGAVRLPSSGDGALRGADGSPLDAASLDWEAGAVWRFVGGPPGLFRVRLRGRGLRVFVPDRGFWSEVPTPRAGVECAVAASPRATESVLTWLRNGGDPVRPLRGAVPAGWSLFLVDRAPEGFPNPDADRVPFLRLSGGVTLDGRARWYHTFAPPRIIVDGNTDDVQVSVNGAALPPADRYELPLTTAPGMVEVTLRHGEQTLDIVRFELVDSFHAGDPQRVRAWASRFGQQATGQSGWCGAWVNAAGLATWPPARTISHGVRNNHRVSAPRVGNRWLVIADECGFRPGNGNSLLVHESWVRYIRGKV